MRCKYTAHKPNICNIWYIKCDSVLNKISMRNYPQTCFQLCCLPVGCISGYKWICITLLDFYNFPSTIAPNDRASDDVIFGYTTIGTCDILSVFPCIRFILKRHLRLKPVKGSQLHYGDVIMSVKWTLSRLFAQLFVQAQTKKSIKGPRHWHLWGESTGDRWIPITKGQ